MAVCLYVCLYVCMYPCTSPLLPSISRNKALFFSSVFAKMMSKNTDFSRFSAKGCRKHKPAKKPAGGIEPGTPVLRPLFCEPPKTTFSGTSSNCRAVLGGGGGGPPPTYQTSGGGGVRGGVILYPLLGVRHAEQCRRILTHTRIFQFRFLSCALRAAGLPEMPTAEPPASAALGSGRRSGELLSLLRTGLLMEADFLGSGGICRPRPSWLVWIGFVSVLLVVI